MGLATVGGAVTALPVAAVPVPTRGCDQAVLAGPARGVDALSKLAGRQPAAAETLRRDPSAWLDRCGNTFFVEPGTSASMTEEETFLTGATSTIPADQAFLLHSRPGSSRVLFLDVDGHRITGTGWNDSFTNGADIQAAPYDTDGDPASFSTAERTAVISIWQRVAEDYAPFDVDVTTADPGAAAIDRSGAGDTAFGTRALITNTTLACGGCAGIGYLDVFDATSYHAYTQPALAFSTSVGGSPKLLADIVSHEVGHNFGLGHDATATASYFNGHGAWTPIMGSATNRALTQWSKGDYEGANNHEDDLAVIAGNGAPRVADDHGDAAGSATPYPTGEAVTGLIGGAADTDWFSFTTSGGTATLSANPTTVGPNLDVRLDVLDSTGTVVASADPATGTTTEELTAGLAASMSPTLPAGTYYVRLDGVGSGDPLVTGYSDYGSVGRYTLSVTAPLVEQPPAEQPPTEQPAPVEVRTTTLAAATRGRPYAVQLAGAGGLAPYSWQVVAGALPAGTSLAGTGRLAGTPTVHGFFTVTVAVTDTVAGSARRTLLLRVNPRPVVTTTSVPTARKGSAYAKRLYASGGTPALRWRVYFGTFPTGLRFSSTGLLSGTPTVRGTRYVTIQVADARGAIVRRTLRIVVG